MNDERRIPELSANGQHEHAEHHHPHPVAHEGTIYTCPMHPEIRQDHLGQCPKCG